MSYAGAVTDWCEQISAQVCDCAGLGLAGLGSFYVSCFYQGISKSDSIQLVRIHTVSSVVDTLPGLGDRKDADVSYAMLLTWKLPTPIMRLMAADEGSGGGALSITLFSLPMKSCIATTCYQCVL